MAVSQDRDKAGPGASDRYPAMHLGFRWPRPERFNIAQVCCRRWALG
jgi:acetyl-CoA synthetase